MKKKYIFIITAVIILSAGALYMGIMYKYSLSKPRVVRLFACGDYCPGPQENYFVKVYEGIKDPVECEKLGGKPSSFVGWGTTYYCLAK